MPDEPISVGGEHRYFVRTYRGGDEMALIALWNRSLPRDTIHPRAFVRDVLCDPRFDPEGALLAVNEQEEAMGFLFAVTESGLGFVRALFVHPEHRRLGLGSALWRAAEQFFRTRGARDVSFCPGGSESSSPGLDREAYPSGAAFFETNGFARLHMARMWGRPLARFAVSDDVQRLYAQVASEGYQFGPLIPGYVVSLVGMLADRHHGDWARLVREAVAREAPFDQFVICTDADGRLVGVASYGLVTSHATRLGPIVVGTAHRRKGIGTVLLELCLDAMRSKGMAAAWASWASEAPALDALFEKAGFSTWRSFDVLHKQLPEPGA